MKKEYMIYLGLILGTLVVANKLRQLPVINKLPQV